MPHVDPVASIVGGLALMLLAAKLGGELAIRVKQPAVLGELVAGILLGNLSFGGAAPFHAIARTRRLRSIAGIGALILLFEVGLESTVGQMLKVGLTSLLVAVLGVVLPFALGWARERMADARRECVRPCVHRRDIDCDERWDHRAGVAGSRRLAARRKHASSSAPRSLTMCSGSSSLAPSAARLPRLRRARHSRCCRSRESPAPQLAFLIGALVIGVYAAPRLFSIASLLQGRGVLVTVSLSFCFVLAWASSLIGLAPIVGAFAAGLVLEDVHFKDFVSRGERSLEELIRPISDALVPIFFVLMGLRTDLGAFTSGGSLELAAALIVVAIIGKQACALGVTVPGVNRLAVGIGMIPRGEVGLIFANVGAGLTLDGVPVIGPSTFSAVVLMVIVTTLVTPPALKWSLERANMSPRSKVRL